MTEQSASTAPAGRNGPKTPPGFRPDWINLTTIVVIHLLGIYAIVYMATVNFSWLTVGLGLLWFICCGLSITGGYHRLFAHRAYTANAPMRLFFALFGAASVQNSILKWASDHRRHHSDVDTDLDPYDINRGFLWAHIGWVVAAGRPADTVRRRDLEADPIVMFQKRYLIPLTVLVAAVIPFALGSLWGDAIGAVLVAGFLRLVVQWHVTFMINSWAHTFGRQNYGTQTSARDSVILALVSFGEGYHSFHHRFPSDYRNGIKWYHVDPTKWLIWTMARIGFTKELRRTAADRIQKARAEAGRRAVAVREVAIASVGAAKAKVDAATAAAASSGLIAAAGTRAAGVPRPADRSRESVSNSDS
ncbi:MAG: stearoyl-CoA desaturase (delta-9 desaturase) [Planctomycetota bacterium]|jgi:stearoyl-CoA desaturase (delta-9 desaturase)